MLTERQSFKMGLQENLGLSFGVIPFGFLAGFYPVKLGFEVWQSVLFSLFIYAGASQIVAVTLMVQAVPVLFVVLPALVVNSRFLLFSAALAKDTKHWPLRWKILNSFLMTDQIFALTERHVREETSLHLRWFMLGASLPLWVFWNVATVMGALLPGFMPDEFDLIKFALPLTFLTILALSVKTGTDRVAAAAGGISAVALMFLPYNAGLVVATFCGIGAAMAFDRYRGKE